MYKKGTKKFDQSKYKCPFDTIDLKFNTGDNMYYICLTCHGHLKKQSKPPEAVWNMLDIVSPPEICQILTKIYRRILFKKFNFMPKGRFPKLKGSICNTPTKSDDINNALPRVTDSNGLLVVKLKRRLSYRGHIYFEAVRPELIHQGLIYLKQNSSLYCDIGIA